MEKLDESRTRRDEKGRKYNKMDKRANDKLVRSPEENGGRYGRDETRRRGRPRERMERGSRNRSSSAGSEKLLLSAVFFLVVAQSSSEVPEGLMNNPVF